MQTDQELTGLQPGGEESGASAKQEEERNVYIPGVSIPGCFLEVFKYLRASKKHVTPGIVVAGRSGLELC